MKKIILLISFLFLTIGLKAQERSFVSSNYYLASESTSPILIDKPISINIYYSLSIVTIKIPSKYYSVDILRIQDTVEGLFLWCSNGYVVRLKGDKIHVIENEYSDYSGYYTILTF